MERSRPQGLPLTHLWFLYYLCIFYVARPRAARGHRRPGTRAKRFEQGSTASCVPAFRATSRRSRSRRRPSPCSSSDTGLAGLVRHPHARHRTRAAAPGARRLRHRLRARLAAAPADWPARHARAAVAGEPRARRRPHRRLSRLDRADAQPARSDRRSRADRRCGFVYTAGYALSIWYWTFGLLGAAVRFFSRRSPVRRYLADASYWFYLVHLPIVFALQVLLMNVPLHWTLKFPLILARHPRSPPRELPLPRPLDLRRRNPERPAVSEAAPALVESHRRRRPPPSCRALFAPSRPKSPRSRATPGRANRRARPRHQALRQDGRPRRSLSRGAARRAPRGAGPERRRQVDGDRPLARHASAR